MFNASFSRISVKNVVRAFEIMFRFSAVVEDNALPPKQLHWNGSPMTITKTIVANCIFTSTCMQRVIYALIYIIITIRIVLLVIGFSRSISVFSFQCIITSDDGK